MPYKIIVSGIARTDYENLKDLHGIYCQQCFSEYFHDETFHQKGISGGFMHFEFNADDGKLYTITEYDAEKKLAAADLEKLRAYTVGQWSDGIGEGFEQFPCRVINGEEIYLSPWYYGQVATITQEEAS